MISSNVKSVGHEKDVLEVEFKGSGVYRYKGVPKELADQLVRSGSVGRFLRENVLGKFEAERVQ